MMKYLTLAASLALLSGALLLLWLKLNNKGTSDPWTADWSNTVSEPALSPQRSNRTTSFIQPVPPIPTSKLEKDGAPAGAVEGEFLVRAKSAEDADILRRYAEQNGLVILGEIPDWNVFRLSGSIEDWQQALDENMVIEYNFPLWQPGFPDPEFIDTSLLPGFGGNVGLGVGVISIDPRWGEGVVVAILDSGIAQHPALEGVAIRTIDLMGNSGDGSGHGLAVANIIAGQYEGAPGLAQSVSLIDLRVLDAAGFGSSFSVAAGIKRAVDEGAHIINMSLGSYYASPLLTEAVNYAERRGVLLIAAVGNDGYGRAMYPAAYSSVLGSSAHDAGGQQAAFSNYGRGNDISAPGVGIYAPWIDRNWVAFDGTSASAPVVAAAAAVLLSKEPNLNASDLRTILKSQTQDSGVPGNDAVYGWGSLDLGRALYRNQNGVVDLALTGFTISTIQGRNQITVNVQNLGTEVSRSANVKIKVDDNTFLPIAIGTLSPGEVHSLRLPIELNSLSPGQAVRLEAVVESAGASPDVRLHNNQLGSTLTISPGP